MKLKVLFVCMGNICRSPAAEAVLMKMLKDSDFESLVYVDSAGIHDYHEGELADSRMRSHGQKRGYQLLSRSRPVDSSDGELFDFIIAMDSSNVCDLKSIIPPQYHDKICMMNDFSSSYKGKVVPDPYYGGDAGFDLVLDMLEDANIGLLKEIEDRLKR